MNKRALIYYSSYTSPIGPVFAAMDEGGLTDIMIKGDEEGLLERLEKRHPSITAVQEMGRFSPLFKEMERYFRGERVGFSRIRLNPAGTAFDLKVWKALTLIPWGSTVSYVDVARLAGSPRAARAAGGACGRNPLPIVIPCHRVISSDGKIGGYTGGLGIKRALLKVEGITGV